MARVPADLHIHLDNDVTKERVIKILKSAEENGLKAICLLEHNNLEFYKRGGVLEELLIEGIDQYYTGKIVTGVELNCTVKNAPVSEKTGIDYNGYDMHIMYYGFNPKLLKRKVDWFNQEIDAVRYYSDVDSLVANLKKLDLPEPPKSIFRYTEGVKPFKQLYKYIQTCSDKEKYESVLGTYPHASAFVRNLAYDPNSIIYFDRAQSPSIVDIINVGKECSKFMCISYPYHINRKLIKDVEDYIETLQAIPCKTKDKNFNCIEGPYMLNTDEETNHLVEYAANNKLYYTAGSDYQPQDKMYYLPPDASEKLWYAPAPGLYVRQLFEGGRGLLTIEQEFLDALPDVREYNIYRCAPPKATKPATEQKPVEEVATEETVEQEVTTDVIENAVETVAPETQEVVEAPVEDVEEEVSLDDIDTIQEEPAQEIAEEVEESVTSAEAFTTTCDYNKIIQSANKGDQTTVLELLPALQNDMNNFNDIEDDLDEDFAHQFHLKIREVIKALSNVGIRLNTEAEDGDDLFIVETPAEEVDVVVEKPDIPDLNEEPAEEPVEEIVENEEVTEEPVEEIAEEVTEEVSEELVEEVVEEAPVVEKKPAPAKKPTPKQKAPAKKKEETVDALDDTLALLEQLTNDVE